MSPVISKRLRYLIGKDADPGTDDSITVIGYDATTPPKNGAKYVNLLDEKGSRQYGPYLPDNDMTAQYGETVPDPKGEGFWRNLREQLDRAKGFDLVELDNLDSFDTSVAMLCFDEVARHGFKVLVKNPLLVDGDQAALMRHPAACGAIVEPDCGTPAEMQAIRNGLPVYFVSGDYDDPAASFPNLPTGQPMPEAAPWLADALSSIGRYHDGPDVPKLAQEVADAFPDVPGLAAYCKLAKDSTPWCGIFVAAILSRYGIKPPFVKGNDIKSFMWVDAWLNWGEKIAVGQERPGDLALYLNSPHHITFVAGNGQYVGGNQGNAVTKIGYRKPDAIRRPLAVAVEKPPPKPASSRFKVCLARVLREEGGNDDDPRDPGGRTSRGITAETWANWRKTHPGLPADVWEAPQSEVEAIYLERYWQPLWADQLPLGVDHAVFDFGVNSGISRSAKFLQEIVGSDVDGEVGPNTIAATKEADPVEVINTLCDNRMYFLKGLSTWGTYGNGWTARVGRVRRDALADADAAPMPEPDDDEVKPVPAKTIKEVIAQIEAERKAALARIDAMTALIKQAAALAEKPAPIQTGQDILNMVPEWVVPLAWPYIQQMSGDQVLTLLRSFKSASKPSGANTAIIAGSAAAGGLGLGAFIIQVLQHFAN